MRCHVKIVINDFASFIVKLLKSFQFDVDVTNELQKYFKHQHYILDLILEIRKIFQLLLIIAKRIVI